MSFEVRSRGCAMRRLRRVKRMTHCWLFECRKVAFDGHGTSTYVSPWDLNEADELQASAKGAAKYLSRIGL